MSFSDDIMGKARRIQDLAIQKRVGEINRGSGGHPGFEVSPGTEKWDHVASQYGWIPMVYDGFCDPDPASFDFIIDSLEATRKKLDSVVMEKMDAVEKHVLDWNGYAAEQFAENVLIPFPKVVDHQYALAGVLMHAMDANKEIWVRTRNDVTKVADDTITALESMGDCGADDWNMGLTVLGAVVGIGAAAVTGGGSLAVTLTVVASGSSVAAAGVSNAGTAEMPMGGDTVDQVLEKMATALSRIWELINDNEDEIISALNKDYEVITTSAGRKQIVAPRPAIADATPGQVRNGFTSPS